VFWIERVSEAESLYNFKMINNNHKTNKFVHWFMLCLSHLMHFAPIGPSSVVAFTISGSDVTYKIAKVFARSLKQNVSLPYMYINNKLQCTDEIKKSSNQPTYRIITLDITNL
jgi:hypothetical protein